MPTTTLETCLSITSSFEGRPGGPNWDLVTGNFDGMGISVGALQWNPGTGSIFKLLKKTFSNLGGDPEEFGDIHEMSLMKPRAAKDFAIQHWTTPGDPRGRLTPEATVLWKKFLSTEGCIQAQKDLAGVVLAAAGDDAEHYLPWMTQPDLHTRAAAFFFDLHVQQGGMSKRRDDGTWQAVEVLTGPEAADPRMAIDFAIRAGKTSTPKAWQAAVDSGDTLAAVLLHYAYMRSSMARPQYVWDTLSRRGTIAARKGSVHGTWVDLTPVLA